MKNDILNFVDEGVVVTRRDFTIIDFNEAFRGFVKFSDIKDVALTQFVSFPNMASAFEAVEKEGTFRGESPVYFLNERRECIVNIVCEDEKFFWIFKDVTPMKLLQRAKADFVSSVSHEFMTPLGIIDGFLSIVEDDELSVEKRKEYVERARTQLKRLEKLVDQLLSLSELEMKRYVPAFSIVNLLEMLQEAKNEMAYRWRAKGVKILLPQKECFVKTDGNALYRIFTNLLSNSIKYSYEDGNVEIFIEENDEHVLVSFIDHGIGIRKDEIPRIFERFYRASNCAETNAKGMGLGLSLVKHLCDVIGAQVKVVSRYALGTTFTVILPKTVSGLSC